MAETAFGMIETRGLVCAIEAADAMMKAAEVRLVSIERTDAALMTAQVVGEVAAVKAAVEAGRLAGERVGTVISVHVIPRPDPDVRVMQGLDAEPPASEASFSPPSLAKMTVRELRALARDASNFPLQGREIARATKKQLTNLLEKHATGR